MTPTGVPPTLSHFVANSRIALTLAEAGTHDLPLSEVNDAFLSLTGYDRDEVIGRNCRFLQGSVREERPCGEIRLFLEDQNRTHLRVSLVNFRKDGTPFVNLLAMTRLRDLTGRTRYFFASQFDVSRARTEQLHSYDERLTHIMPLPGPVARDTGLVLSGSVSAISDAAAAIAQAKLTLESVDAAGPLY